MPRQNFSKATIARRYKACGRRCEGKLANGKRCNAILKGGDYHADHDNPDGLTGKPTFENCRILCIACHAIKTPKDRKHIAQAQRREAKDCGVPRTTPPIQSRGFDHKPKPEKLACCDRKKDAFGRST